MSCILPKTANFPENLEEGVSTLALLFPASSLLSGSIRLEATCMSVHSVTLPEAQGTTDIYMVFWVSHGMTKTEDRELVLRKDCPEIVEPHGEIFDGQTWEVSHQDP